MVLMVNTKQQSFIEQKLEKHIFHRHLDRTDLCELCCVLSGIQSALKELKKKLTLTLSKVDGISSNNKYLRKEILSDVEIVFGKVRE